MTDLVNQIDDAIALILVSMLASKVRDISTPKNPASVDLAEKASL